MVIRHLLRKHFKVKMSISSLVFPLPGDLWHPRTVCASVRVASIRGLLNRQPRTHFWWWRYFGKIKDQKFSFGVHSFQYWYCTYFIRQRFCSVYYIPGTILSTFQIPSHWTFTNCEVRIIMNPSYRWWNLSPRWWEEKAVQLTTTWPPYSVLRGQLCQASKNTSSFEANFSHKNLGSHRIS